MTDPKVMPEMVDAGVKILNQYLSDSFGLNGFPFVEELVADIYCAMDDARPPGYYAKLLRAIRDDAEHQ